MLMTAGMDHRMVLDLTKAPRVGSAGVVADAAGSPSSTHLRGVSLGHETQGPYVPVASRLKTGR